MVFLIGYIFVFYAICDVPGRENPPRWQGGYRHVFGMVTCVTGDIPVQDMSGIADLSLQLSIADLGPILRAPDRHNTELQGAWCLRQSSLSIIGYVLPISTLQNRLSIASSMPTNAGSLQHFILRSQFSKNLQKVLFSCQFEREALMVHFFVTEFRIIPARTRFLNIFSKHPTAE
jgi:hypothetical protein